MIIGFFVTAFAQEPQHDEPTATLFVSLSGDYILDISLQNEWQVAELSIDKIAKQVTTNNFRYLHHEGNFDVIPSALNIRMELASENKGSYLNTYISPIYLPFSPPELSGDQEKPLAKPTLSWKVYRFFYERFKNE